ncbi:MAG: hypothetical protein MUC65_07035 [Pontiellaceae bacterium]|jgi:hypothetical protein|nr:hypothetical protein [Pontiellaceae bacterium]
MEFPIRKLLKYCDAYESLIWWENLFGKAFRSILPFLAPCADRRAEFYPSTDHPAVKLTIRESGRRYRAVPPEDCAHEVDDIILDWEDVQAHHLDCDRLRSSLQKAFNLRPAASRPVDGLFYIGRCDGNKEYRHVYACLAVSDQKALQAAECCTDPNKTGCILFPAHHTKAFDLLKSRGIAAVALRECLSIKPDGFHGTCTSTCTGCSLPSGDTVKLESRLETIEKTVLPDARRGSKTKNAASEGGKARAELYQPKIEEARQFIRKYHLENRSMCFTQALRKAAQHLDLGESTLKKYLKKGDFPDW